MHIHSPRTNDSRALQRTDLLSNIPNCKFCLLNSQPDVVWGALILNWVPRVYQAPASPGGIADSAPETYWQSQSMITSIHSVLLSLAQENLQAKAVSCFKLMGACCIYLPSRCSMGQMCFAGSQLLALSQDRAWGPQTRKFPAQHWWSHQNCRLWQLTADPSRSFGPPHDWHPCLHGARNVCWRGLPRPGRGCLGSGSLPLHVCVRCELSAELFFTFCPLCCGPSKQHRMSNARGCGWCGVCKRLHGPKGIALYTTKIRW